MKIRPGRKFWIAATAIIVVLTLFVVGRNALHAVKIKGQINAMLREELFYRERIAQDSALVEQLRYDDYLARFGSPLYPLGRITARPGLVWLRDGRPEPLDWHGFEHF